MSDHGCPAYREADSSTKTDSFCAQKKDKPDKDIEFRYCGNSVDCIHCPVRGGDDRLRNPDCLTEEVCEAIITSMSEILNDTMKFVMDSFQELYQFVAQTGYLYLAGEIDNWIGHRIALPDFHLEFVNKVKTEPEKARARALEETLDSMIENCQPCEHIEPLRIYGDVPKITDLDFAVMDRVWMDYTCDVQNIAESPADANGIGIYEGILAREQSTLGQSLYYYFDDIGKAINTAWSVFDAGCAATFSHIGNVNVYSGRTPRFFNGGD